MGLKRNVSLATALRYQGRDPVDFCPASHRRTGHGNFCYDAYSGIVYWRQDRGFLNTIYENWFFQIFIFFCVLIPRHQWACASPSLTCFPKLLEHQREAIWVEWAVFIPIFAIAVFVIISSALGG